MSRNINVNVAPINDNDFKRTDPNDNTTVDGRAGLGTDTLGPSKASLVRQTEPAGLIRSPEQVSLDVVSAGSLENLPSASGGTTQGFGGLSESQAASSSPGMAFERQAGEQTSLLYQGQPRQSHLEGPIRRRPLRGYRWNKDDIEEWDLRHREEAMDIAGRLNTTEGEYVAKMMPLTRSADNDYERWWWDVRQRRFVRTQFRDQSRLQDFFPLEALQKPVNKWPEISMQLKESLGRVKEQTIQQAKEIGQFASGVTTGMKDKFEGDWVPERSTAQVGASVAAQMPSRERIRSNLNKGAEQLKAAMPSKEQMLTVMPSKEQLQAGAQKGIDYLRTAGRVSMRAGRYAKEVVAPKLIEKTSRAKEFATGVAAPSLAEQGAQTLNAAQSMARPLVPKARAAVSMLADKTSAGARFALQKPLKLVANAPINEDLKASLIGKTQEDDLVTFADTYHRAGMQGTVNYVESFRSDYLGLDLYRPLKRRGVVGKAKYLLQQTYGAPLSTGLEIVRSPGFMRFQNVALIVLGAIVVRKVFQKRAAAATIAMSLADAASSAALAVKPGTSPIALSIAEKASSIAAPFQAGSKFAAPVRKLTFRKKVFDTIISMNPSLYGLSLIGNAFGQTFRKARDSARKSKPASLIRKI